MTKIKILLAALIALAAGIGGVALRLQQVVLTPQATDIKENFRYDTGSGTLNILVVGVDDTEGSHRADSIALANINIDTKRIKILSLPRDTRVQIPGHGWQKINHAFAYGGVDLLRKTVVNFLGVAIDYHVVINYDSFPKLVDLVGGVDLVVEKHLKYRDRAGGLNIDIPKGPQHMDGKTALLYVRFRHDPLGDIGRVQRQQRFLQALMRKIKDKRVLAVLPDIAKEALDVVETNLTATQALQLAAYLRELPQNAVSFAMLPGHPAYISGISYWLAEIKDATKFLTEDAPLSPDIVADLAKQETLSGDEVLVEEDDSDIVAGEGSFDASPLVRGIIRPVAVLNGDGTKGVSNKVAKRLQEMGIDVAYVGNAKHFDYYASNILYPQKGGEEMRKTAKNLASLCGISSKLVKVDTKATYATVVIGHDYGTLLRRLGDAAFAHQQ